MDYRSTRWERLRAQVLRRDGYRCRECARYGLQREATTAHHVFPAGLFPALQWDPDNLIALCGSCHDAMHVRATEELTPKGYAWTRRIPVRPDIPPSSPP